MRVDLVSRSREREGKTERSGKGIPVRFDKNIKDQRDPPWSNLVEVRRLGISERVFRRIFDNATTYLARMTLSNNHSELASQTRRNWNERMILLRRADHPKHLHFFLNISIRETVSIREKYCLRSPAHLGEVVLVKLSSRAELREIIRRRSLRRPHVHPTCVSASRTTRPCPPQWSRGIIKKKKTKKKGGKKK
ncbi:hypothetical protein PUN28_013588 [Cardiocondyla obscurior]|uniref:Ribosomal protein S10 n=1 Tax=Cardiocondyla obscurior TaxID=286306 RepID=A0AAW2F777_9HYME